MKDPHVIHPPYSPDLAPADFFLFPNLQIAMKGTRFGDVSSTQQTMTRELKAIREEAFSRAFDSLYERYKRLWPQFWNLIVTPCITDTQDPQNTTK
jgi:hypothetical protein